MNMGDSKSDALHPPSYERGVADERARCMAALECLHPGSVPSLYSYGKGYSDAIAEAATLIRANASSSSSTTGQE